MRKACWLAGTVVILAASVAAGHPPGGDPCPQSEGRVPLYPDGERYREAQPAQTPPAAPTQPEPVRPRKENAWLRDRLEAFLGHFEMDLLLPPLDL